MLNLQEKRRRRRAKGGRVNKKSSIVLHKKSYIEGRKKKKTREKSWKNCATNKQLSLNVISPHTHLLLTHAQPRTHPHRHPAHIQAHTHTYASTHLLVSGGRLEEKRTKVVNILPKVRETRAQKASKNAYTHYTKSLSRVHSVRICHVFPPGSSSSSSFHTQTHTHSRKPVQHSINKQFTLSQVE